MYELVLGQPISRQSFRKKMWESEILIPLEETVTEGGRSQPRGLYRFNKKKYYELKRKGFFLDL
jgi:8-oxo-dGTP diphosphatase